MNKNNSKDDNITIVEFPELESKKSEIMFHIISDQEAKERDDVENLFRLKEIRKSYPKEDSKKTGFATIEVLEKLKGTPYNNAAHNFLKSLRPSSIRVVEYGNPVTSDAKIWRVTVYLDINKNIGLIEQEVEVGLTGFRNGRDAENYYEHHYEELEKPIPNIIFNINTYKPKHTLGHRIFKECQTHNVQGCLCGCNKIECCDNPKRDWKLFCDSNEVNFVLAESAEEALKLYCKLSGDTEDNFVEDYGMFCDTKFELDKVIKIRDDDGTLEEKKLRDWIAESEKGLLYSTEF